jgi:hypothetical protein
MDTLKDDIQYLNEQLFLIANEQGEPVLRSMEASPAVARRITAASANGIGTAIRCGVPLVTFTSVLEELALSDPRKWRIGPQVELSPRIQELTRFMLEFARDLVRVNFTVAQMYFGFSRLAAQAYTRLGMKQRLQLSSRHGLLLRLLAAQRNQDWDRLLIGERLSGPLAYQISQQTGLMMLGEQQ